MNKLHSHTPRSSAVIRFSSGELIAILIAPSGIIVEKLWLHVFRRRLLRWSQVAPKQLDRTLVIFMAGPDTILPGDSVLEFMATRFLRECQSIRDMLHQRISRSSGQGT